MAISLEAPENFRKFIILNKCHIFCILAALQYFDEKITFDDKVIKYKLLEDLVTLMTL